MSKFSVMTKTLGSAAVACVLSAGISFNAQAAYPQEMEADLIKVCEAIRDNKNHKLHRAVKRSRVSYRDLERGLVCNGMDIHAFALSSKAEVTGAFLAKRLKYSRTLTASR